MSFGVPAAQVVEIEIKDKKVNLKKIYAAVDIGKALDPKNIEAQIQSGIIYSLSAAIQGEITIQDGKVEQTNFHDYNGLRLHQTPEIEIEILENQKKIRGIGEPGTPPVAPALGNAIYAATQKRIRELPFKKSIEFL